jgi:hypothetical protein
MRPYGESKALKGEKFLSSVVLVKMMSRVHVKAPCGRFVPDTRQRELAKVEWDEVMESLWEYEES